MDSCDDEDMSNLVPYLSLAATAGAVEEDIPVTAALPDGVLFKWEMTGTTFVSQWDDPTLLQTYEGQTTFNTSQHVLEYPDAGAWAYFVISTTLAVTHPIHLHGISPHSLMLLIKMYANYNTGHDFFLLAQGTGAFNSTTPLLLSNPPRRDVATLPLSGYIVIGFPIDNPGVWLMHCHIGWHTEEGLALQILEMADDIPATVTGSDITDTCTAWKEYTSTTGYDLVMDYQDSGI